MNNQSDKARPEPLNKPDSAGVWEREGKFYRVQLIGPDGAPLCCEITSEGAERAGMWAGKQLKRARWYYDDANSCWRWKSPLGEYFVSAWDGSASGPKGFLIPYSASIASAKRKCVVHCIELLNPETGEPIAKE